jgi:hypothetical protein
MSGTKNKHAALVAGKQAALRQTGESEWHPDECGCRKCRRARVAQARRATPRYGQAPMGQGASTTEPPSSRYSP